MVCNRKDVREKLKTVSVVIEKDIITTKQLRNINTRTQLNCYPNDLMYKNDNVLN